MGQTCGRCTGEQIRRHEILSFEEDNFHLPTKNSTRHRESEEAKTLQNPCDVTVEITHQKARDKVMSSKSREELQNKKTVTELMDETSVMGLRAIELSIEMASSHQTTNPNVDPIIQQPNQNEESASWGEIIKRGESTILSSKSSISSLLGTMKSVVRIERSNFVRLLNLKVNSRYHFHEMIGEGSFGRVYRATCVSNNEERAIKIIRKDFVSPSAFEAEMGLLRQMDHPNIVRVYEVYDYENFFFVVMEYCEGGELFHLIKKVKRFSERQAANIMKQLLGAVVYMHGLGIAHRDLKPENIVVESREEGRIKIVDFGSAIKETEPLRKKVGSPYYMAPEVLSEEYTKKCDVWSCGIILFVLLCGHPPFRGPSHQELFRKILKEKVHYDEKYWRFVSKEARALISRMLDKLPGRRITAAEALNDPWINIAKAREPVSLHILKQMESFSFRSNFLAIVETYLASNTISQQERSTLAKAFKQIDRDGSGIIERNELIEAYRSVYGAVNDRFVENIIEKIDTNGSGKIDFTEFLTACTSRKRLFHKKALVQAFEFFDKDGTGYIDVKELRELMGEAEGGNAVSEIAKILQDLDGDGDMQISKEEFLNRLVLEE